MTNLRLLLGVSAAAVFVLSAIMDLLLWLTEHYMVPSFAIAVLSFCFAALLISMLYILNK